SLADQPVGGLAQNVLAAPLPGRLPSDLEKDRHRQRRYPVERLVHDVSPDAAQKIAQTGDVEKPGRRIRPSRFQQNMARLMLTQNVVYQVRRDRDLSARFLEARMMPLNEAGDHRAYPEGALHQARFSK